ncbi:MAG: DUF167 domain-containing protein [Sphingomonadaceae bacterium]
MTTLRIHVQPGASTDEISAQEGDLLRVRLRARAIEGKANKRLVEFLAEALGLRPRQVTLIRGERSREKLVEVELPSLEEVAARLRK